MPSYIADFQAAISRTEALGLDPDAAPFPHVPEVLTQEHGEQLLKIAEISLRSDVALTATDIACRCGQVSLSMREHVKRVTGHQAILTVGTFSYEGTPLIVPSSNDLDDMAATGSYHVWLTMPWMEIIDFTVLVSLAVLKGTPLSNISPVAGYPDFISPLSWKPLYVGTAATKVLLDPR